MGFRHCKYRRSFRQRRLSVCPGINPFDCTLPYVTLWCQWIENENCTGNKIVDIKSNYEPGMVIWLTGLSGTGKSTLAEKLVSRLRKKGLPAIMLDGDELRNLFYADTSKSVDFTRATRLESGFRYGKLCQMLSNQGFIIVIATISMYEEIYKWNRENISKYFEVFLNVPIQELRRRDPKGLYKQFDAGKIQNIAGLDLPIDEPKLADWTINFENSPSADELATKLLNKLESHWNEINLGL